MFKITKNLILQDFSSMRVMSETLCDLYEIDAVEDIQELEKINFFQEKFYIIGEGTNTVFVTEEKINLLKINFKDIEISEAPVKKIKVGAGINWDEFVKIYMELGGTGMEVLSIIPGTVGASPVQNIGAYGAEVSEFITSVYVYDVVEKKFVELSNTECDFSYRNSIFKNNKNRYLVLYVNFILKNEPVKIPEYKDVINYFAKNGEVRDVKDLWESGRGGGNVKKGEDDCSGKNGEAIFPATIHNQKDDNKTISAKDLREAIIFIRNLKFPNIKALPNCGSFFANPIISQTELENVKKIFPEIPVFPARGMKTENSNDEYLKIPLGYILEKMGYRGKEIGNFSMYKEHALILTNKKGDTKEFLEFIDNLKEEIKNEIQIKIEPEVNII